VRIDLNPVEHTGLPPHAFSSIYLFALSELLGATTLAKLPVTYYHTS
jgi:hypothetical protein